MRIRRESPADIAAIHALHAASFPTPGEARLVDTLRAAGHLWASLVAVENEQLMGHVAFSPVTLDRAAIGLGLGPIAVRSDYRRRGIAERLVRGGLELCRNGGVSFVVVLGDPRYYVRFGFEPARRWAMRDEFEGGDAFQALELVPGAMPPGGGLVRYCAEFAALEA